MTSTASNPPDCVKVEIYVSEHCPVCAYAYEVAEMIRHEFPAVAVHLINMEDAGISVPENVFATPTYLVNGHRWSLGNPSPDRVRAILTQALNP